VLGTGDTEGQAGGPLLTARRGIGALNNYVHGNVRAAGIDLFDIDVDARRTVESDLARFFEVSADVIAKRMKAEKMWG
jgi:hypothetical protein